MNPFSDYNAVLCLLQTHHASQQEINRENQTAGLLQFKRVNSQHSAKSAYTRPLIWIVENNAYKKVHQFRSKLHLLKETQMKLRNTFITMRFDDDLLATFHSTTASSSTWTTTPTWWPSRSTASTETVNNFIAWMSFWFSLPLTTICISQSKSCVIKLTNQLYFTIVQALFYGFSFNIDAICFLINWIPKGVHFASQFGRNSHLLLLQPITLFRTKRIIDATISCAILGICNWYII